jgi:HK97 family phage portal protein
LNLFGWVGSLFAPSTRSFEGSQTITINDLKEDTFYDGLGSVNARTSLGYAPLYQAVSMISGDVAKLPLNVYRLSDDGRSVANDHPAHRVLKKNSMTNEEINSYKFMRRFMTSALLWGNAYAYIDRARNGRIRGLYQLLPDRTYMQRTKSRLYCFTEVGARLERLDARDVLHIEGVTIDGLQGESIIKRFREDFEKALNAKKFSSRFFKNGMSVGGFLQAPPQAKPEAVRKVQDAVNQHFSGPDNAFKTVVLRDGFKWFSTQIDPRAGQLTETHEEDARNIARIYNISPSRLGLKNSTSYNSEEMARRDYYDGALSHWCHAISSEFSTKLLSEEERDLGFYIEHNVNALLWADAKTRSEIASQGIMTGRFSPQETRAWENMNSYEGSDKYWMPLNLQEVNGQPQADPAIAETARAILRNNLSRMASRISIKCQREKENPVKDDHETLFAMINDSYQLCSKLQHRSTNGEVERLLETLAAIPAESLDTIPAIIEQFASEHA